jgi:hypothetical protein
MKQITLAGKSGYRFKTICTKNLQLVKIVVLRDFSAFFYQVLWFNFTGEFL